MVQLFFTLKIHLVLTKGAELPALKTAAWCCPPEQALQEQGGCVVWHWPDNAAQPFYEVQSLEVS